MQTAEQRHTMISKDEAMRDQTAIVKATKEACENICKHKLQDASRNLCGFIAITRGHDLFHETTGEVKACKEILTAIRNLTIEPEDTDAD